MIKVLSKETIDKIAAGEVVEKPQNVVKELVDNSLDSGASAISIEVRGGGMTLIRVTDNGCGIEKDDLKTAFLRHATSKITSAEDLSGIRTMGFRGEALSSISAVSRVEVLTKRKDTLYGYRYTAEAGSQEKIEEIGIPDGTTVIVTDQPLCEEGIAAIKKIGESSDFQEKTDNLNVRKIFVSPMIRCRQTAEIHFS